MNADQLLIHAIEALYDGNRALAGAALARLVRSNPGNKYGWLWLSRVVDTPDRQRYCLERSLRLDPAFEDALQESALLENQVPQSLFGPERINLADGAFSVHLYVAGIRHEARATVVRRLRVRQPIVLRRDPNKPNDPLAIRLETAAGEIFGFVPEDAAKLLAPYLERCQTPLNGVVDELFTSSRGEHMRAGITLFLPAEETELHSALDQLQNAKIEIAYWFEQADDAIDLMLDCTENTFREICDWLSQCGLEIAAYGTPVRFATDGCNYPWFVHFPSAQVNERQIRKYLEEHYRIRPTAAEIAEMNELFDLSDSEFQRKEADLKLATEKIGWLNQQLEQMRNASIERRGITLEMLYPVVYEHIASRLGPEQILLLLSRLFSDQVIVLDSAYESSRKIERFRNSRRVFELLWKLVTEYPALMRSGDGNRVLCEDVFGREAYAAQDDDSSEYYRQVRTFSYAGVSIYMPEHLKIGKSFDQNETMRIHFKWLKGEEKVVIGYCGPHLPQQA